MTAIEIGVSAAGKIVSMRLAKANRHELRKHPSPAVVRS
jgi:hypothetical protein